MKIHIKRFDKTLPLPSYKTDGAAGIDLYARLDVAIEPGKIEKVPLNIAVQIPEGYVGILAARSSLHKLGLMPINGTGIMDSDYCGDEDEWLAALYNFTDHPIQIEKGMRLMQMLVIAIPRLELTELEVFQKASRGGFGTTNFS